MHNLSAEDIEWGINKLKRRIQEVESLDPSEVVYNDAQVKSLEARIRDSICEIFGEDSAQYKRHQNHHIWHGPKRIGMHPNECQKCFSNGIPQTSRMLEGLVDWLKEQREDLEFDSTRRVLTAFEGLDLHPRIDAVASRLYRDGHYANAVLDASKVLINYVKEESGRFDLDGASLMREVFSKNNPTLAFNSMESQSEMDEQEGLMHLFEGAVLALRNPRAHELLSDSPERALEYIAFLSMLAAHVDDARRRDGGKEAS